MLQIIKIIEGRSLVQSKTFRTNSHSAEINLSQKQLDIQRGYPQYVFEVLDVDFFALMF